MPEPSSAADTWYVAPDGNDASGDGSLASPWRSIAHALNEGVPPAGGGTVLVRPGTYRASSTIRRSFASTVTLRSEIPYAATLTGVDQRRDAVRVYVRGPVRLAIEGFVLSNRHPEHVCDGREAHYIVHLQDVEDVLIRNNIFFGNNAPGTCNELLKINRGSSDTYPKNIRIQGNLFYEPANAGGADMIDSVRPGEIDIVDNIFHSRPERNRSHSFITLKRQAPFPGTRIEGFRYTIRRNVFLSWGGKADQAFIQFGEDGVPEHEITAALIENNLFLGDSPARMSAPLQFKGARGVLVRANTTFGDLPGGAFALRTGPEGQNPQVGDVSILGNIWSDPTGTMSERFVNAYGDVDLDSFEVRRNLFWNGGAAIPRGGAIAPQADDQRIVSDPLLGPNPSGVMLPIWDASSGRFESGSETIREEFLRLVETYASPDEGSPAIDAGEPQLMPADDIRGLARDGLPDVGAYEVDAGSEPPGSPRSTLLLPHLRRDGARQ